MSIGIKRADGVEHSVSTCPRCKQSFECLVASIQHCACKTVTLREASMDFLKKTHWRCLCVSCLKELDALVATLDGQQMPAPQALREGVEYYKEDGRWVFTERYHMLRGYCCENGCRHCAYGYQKQKE